MKEIQELLFPDVETLVRKVMQLDIDNVFCIVAKYNDAVDAVSELIKLGVYPYFMELLPEKWNGYDKEYLIMVNSGNQLFVEPFFIEGRYLDVLDDLGNVYILEDCSHKVVKKCKDLDKVYYVYFDECDLDEEFEEDYYECTGGCDRCTLHCEDDEETELYNYTSETVHVSRDCNNEPDGFTKSWSASYNGVECYSSYSFYSNDNDTLCAVADEWNVEL